MKTYFYFHFRELMFHLILLTSLLLQYFLVCYYYFFELLYICFKPISHFDIFSHFIFINITELFYLKVILIVNSGIFIFFIFFILHSYCFVMHGLYKNENKTALQHIPIIIIVYTCWNYVVFNYLMSFFLSFFIEDIKNLVHLEVHFEPRLDIYIRLISTLFLYSNLFFIYLLVLFYFIRKMDADRIIFYRRPFYLKFMIIATIISPPDFVCQIIICMFCMILLEIFILCKLF